MWDNILTLLAIAVLADHKLRDPELIEFCHEAQLLNDLIDPDRILSRRSLLDWFHHYRSEIDAKLQGPDADIFIRQSFDEITNTELRPHILQSIFGICICDYDLHDEEAHVIQIGVKAWNMSLADSANVRSALLPE